MFSCYCNNCQGELTKNKCMTSFGCFASVKLRTDGQQQKLYGCLNSQFGYMVQCTPLKARFIKVKCCKEDMCNEDIFKGKQDFFTKALPAGMFCTFSSIPTSWFKSCILSLRYDSPLKWNKALQHSYHMSKTNVFALHEYPQVWLACWLFMSYVPALRAGMVGAVGKTSTFQPQGAWVDPDRLLHSPLEPSRLLVYNLTSGGRSYVHCSLCGCIPGSRW